MLKLGTSYYPETTDQSEWERDLKLMKETGLELTRILDFAWPWIEPREGEYDFNGLDTYLDLSDKVGLKVILCTPTATPPAWLARQYPDIMVETRSGDRIPWGRRRHACPTNHIYRHFCAQIAEVLAKRYGNRNTIAGWQIDNEVFGPEGYPNECHCPSCHFGFRQWLKKTYGSIEDVNQTWGTMFWNQVFSDWGEIQTPRSQGSNRGQAIDYYEFFSDSMREFVKNQYDVLRSHVQPSQWVSHNSTGTFNVGVDHRAYGQMLDVAAWDAYPGAAGTPLRASYEGLAHELYRSAKRRPFYVLETSSHHMWPAWWAEMRARGADMMVFWHWRSIRWGNESKADTLCHHDGSPKAGRLETVKSYRKEIQKVDPELPAEIPKANAAFLFSYRNVRYEMRERVWPNGPYLTSIPKSYQSFRQIGVSCDVVFPGQELEGYSLLIAPSLELLEFAEAEIIRKFVAGGGVLWACAPFAHRDGHAKFHLRPGEPVQDILGVRVIDVFPGGETKAEVEGKEYEIEGQSFPVEQISATVLGTFSDGDHQSKPALTVNDFGKGKVFFMTCFSQALGMHAAKLASRAAALAIVDNPYEEVTIIPHLTGKGTWYCNQGSEKVTVNGIELAPQDFVLKKS